MQTYFAAKPGSECAAVLTQKIEAWANNLESNGYTEKLRMAWSAYHGAYYADVGTGHQISFGGAEGEIVNLPVNHIRNLAQHLLVMTTSNRPTMEARATNTDYKSLTQTMLANGLLDYYMREKRLEKFLKKAVEFAIVMGAGFIKMSWNSTSGEEYEFNEETQSPIYEGDVEFVNLNPFDIIMDNTKEDQNHDWIVCRTWKNKYALMAKYPELAEQISQLKTKTDVLRFRFSGIGANETDDIAVYEFYHKRDEALPDGRYLLFLDDDVILYDGPMPYRTLPIFRIAPADILGTPYGYTSIFDLLPMQEAVNSLYSTILTNQNAFGVQNILVPRGADISISELSGGLNIIEANTAAGKPEALNLTQTPAEVFKFIGMIEQSMETLSGVNSVARGNPEASLKSGAALALVQSMAIQFISGLQQSYVQLIEDVGTALVNMLKDFAAVPRVAAIAGKTNRTYMKEFKGEDLSSINRVIVDVGNPLSKTTAGRVQMASELLQMGAIKDPAQYFTVLNTGKLDVMNEGIQADLMLIKGENERMISGKPARTLASDDHRQHIQEHRCVLADPDLRDDEQLTQLVLGHIQEHIEFLKTMPPENLEVFGQQPLQSIPPQTPPAPQPQGNEIAAQQAPQPGAPVQPEGPANLPNLPTPPAPFENNPISPQGLPNV